MSQRKPAHIGPVPNGMPKPVYVPIWVTYRNQRLIPVRRYFDNQSMTIKEEEFLGAVAVDPKRPAAVTAESRKEKLRKIQEWLKVHPFPAPMMCWPVPEWVVLAAMEIHKMYYPKLWQTFTTEDAFREDPTQQGLYYGYQLAHRALIRDTFLLKAKRWKGPWPSKERDRKILLSEIGRLCQHGSLDYLRKFYGAFSRALHDEIVDVETGKPAKESDRFVILFLLVQEWPWVERKFVAKGRLMKELLFEINAKLKEQGKKTCKLDRFEAICQTIGLRL